MSQLLCWKEAASEAKSKLGGRVSRGTKIRLLGGGLLAGLVIAASFGAVGLVNLPVEGQAGYTPGGSGTLFVLQGPNDGEPINSRIVRLKLTTDYEESGNLSVEVNNVYVSSQSLQLGAVRDDRTHLLVTYVEVDLETARRATQNALLGTDATPIKVKVCLLSASTSRLVAFDTWEGSVVRPWLEFMPSGGVLGAPAKTTIVLHTLQGDTYLFMFASTSKDLLGLSPENPRLIREATMLAGRVCDPLTAGKRTREIVYQDSPVDSMGRQIYVVLWTYDDKVGWKRSTISPLPR
jgi:hypothetical protein